MNRPMMDPTFVPDLAKARRDSRRWWRIVLKSARSFGRALLTNPLAVKKPGEPGRRVSPVRVLVRTLACWTLFLPTLTALLAAGFVFVGTHPATPPLVADPRSQGCYFEPVDLPSLDGTHLTGWLVPALDARRVLEDRDRAVLAREPAMVLVHDYGQSAQQMLPLVRPLHEEGVVVLVLSLRGTRGSGQAGQTFGLHESKDVLAGVNMLRGLRYVDPSRVAVAGVGTGATAAMIAASQDSSIRAMVLANPVQHGLDTIVARVAPRERWLRWMRPACVSAFEMMYGVSGADLDYDRYAPVLKTRPVMLLNSDDSFALREVDTARQIKRFCRRNLHPEQTSMSLGAAR